MEQSVVHRESSTVGLPLIQTSSSVGSLNHPLSPNAHDKDSRKTKRHTRNKIDRNADYSSSMASVVNVDVDGSKSRAQINRYKENLSKTKFSKPVSMVDSFYNLSAYSLNGKYISFSSLTECAILVINVATCDPRTNEEFKQLNDLVNQFNNKGFIVLAFLCNQFNNSQPWEHDEVMRSLRYVRPGQKYEPNFPIFQTCDVNGQFSNPVFEYLKLKQPFPFDDFVTMSAPFEIKPANSTANALAKYYNPLMNWSPIQRSDIGSNFEKFLIDKNGQVIARYTRKKSISTIIPEIEQLLGKKGKENRSNISYEFANIANN